MIYPFSITHRWPLIGMLHLPPLPGSFRAGKSLDEIVQHTLADARMLAEQGFDGLLLENFGDSPFYPERVPAITVAAMTAVAAEVRRAFPQLPLGINVLRNDGRSALAIAVAVGAAFIRVNVLCSARVTDQGVISGIAHDLLRERAALRAEVSIWADVAVKHSAALAPRPLAEEARELVERGGADVVLVTGSATGSAPSSEELRQVRDAVGDHPVFVASGVTAENLPQFTAATGFIVGSCLKSRGNPLAPIDNVLAKRVSVAVESIRQ